MAVEADNAILNMAVSLEETRLEAKRQKTNNPDWKPAGDDNHGAGIMPEEVWKKYSPKSKDETAIGGANNG